MPLSFIVAAMASLSLPGLSLSLLFKIKNNLTLNSIAISYSLFFLIYTALLYTGNLAHYLVISYASILIASFFYILFYLLKHKHQFSITVDFFAALLILALVIFYQLFIGIYTEIPSDLYAHMERYQYALGTLLNTNQINPPSVSNLLHQGYGWYAFLAMLSKLVPVSTTELVEAISVITNSAFLLCIYFFAKTVFSGAKNATLIALLTCVLTCLHMGINVFAFIRYYALAPTMLGFCLYSAAIATLINTTQQTIGYRSITAFLLMGLFTLTAFSNHTQEAMFVVIMSSLIISLHAFSNFRQTAPLSEMQTLNKRIWLILAVLAIIGFIGIYLYAQANLSRAPNSHWRLWEFGQGFGLIPQISTLNLKFQFIRVLTLWGCLIYLLFILNWQRYKHNHFIIAGMISPFFTILNPFFVDLFLRLDNSTTLWRLTYIIPIHFVAADLFILYLQKLREFASLKKAYPLIAIALLVGLLLPINNTWQDIHYSRVPSLQATQYQNSLYYYSDVLTVLTNIEEKHNILTDPVTGYVVASMTHHTSPRRKFTRSRAYRHFTFEEYDEETLSDYKGFLLLLNQREQPVSQIGYLSRHWSHRELQNISNYYPEQLITHLSDNSHLFEKLWSNNGMSIYRIK